MAYPGPPGVGSQHPSLPPRPNATSSPAPPGTSSTSNPPASRFSSAFSSTSAPPSAYPSFSAAPTTSSYYGTSQTPSIGGRGGAPGYTPRQQQTHTQSYSYNQQQPAAYGGSYAGFGGAQQRGSAGGYGATTYGTVPQSYGTTGSPAMRNPFPVPIVGASSTAGASGGNDADYDPETAAQIAQWHSAYIPRDEAAALAAGEGVKGSTAAGAKAGGSEAQAAAAGAAVPAEGAEERKRTVYRSGGGKKWADDTLTEWDPAHLRLFVGNLAGEVTDESLMKAFARWKSVQKTKVIRDNRTHKSKGYGFVSFSDPDDFFQAAKEMNGKYIQSHPVTVRKSTTEIKHSNVKEDKKGGKWKNKKGGNGGGNKSGNGSGGGASGQQEGAYEPRLGPLGGGVQKKRKDGMKILG